MTIDVDRLAVDAEYWNEVAPDGATHFMYSEKFVKWVDGVEWAFHASSSRKWKQSFCGWSLQQYFDCGDYIMPKPTKPAAQEWDGEGLPPVGCECEVKGAVENWCKCKIVAHHKSRAVFFCDHWAHESDYDALPASNFRPIRSQEQREREEIINAAVKVIDVKFGSPRSIYVGYCESLYDAGMLRRSDK
jgi:hypothetical protein